MYKHIQLTLLILFAPWVAAQHQVVLDMSTGILVPLDCALESDGTVAFKVDGLNPFLYTCTVKGNNIQVLSEASGPWSNMMGWQQKSDDVNEATKDSQAEAGAPDTDPGKVKERHELELKLEELHAERQDLFGRLSALQDLDFAQKSSFKAFGAEAADPAQEQAMKDAIGQVLLERKWADPAQVDALKGKGVGELHQYLANTLEAAETVVQEQLANTRVESARTAIELAKLANNPLPDLLLPVQVAAKDVSARYADLMLLGDYYKALEGITRNSCLRPAAIMDQVRALEASYPLAANPHGVLRQVNDALAAYDIAYASYIRQWKEVADDSEHDRAANVATPIVQAVDRIRKDLKDFDYSARITTSEQVRQAAVQASTYEEISQAVQAKGDIVEFSYEIEPRYTDAGPCALKTIKGTHAVHVKGGWKIDWGTGITGTFGIKDESFRLDPDPDVQGSSILVANEQDARFRPGLAATMHLSPRSCRQFKPQLMAGLALDMTELSTGSFFLGTGLLFGRQELFSLHGGISFQRADVLKSGLVEGRSYAADAIDASDLVEKQFTSGWFVGLSYIITKQEKID